MFNLGTRGETCQTFTAHYYHAANRECRIGNVNASIAKDHGIKALVCSKEIKHIPKSTVNLPKGNFNFTFLSPAILLNPFLLQHGTSLLPTTSPVLLTSPPNQQFLPLETSPFQGHRITRPWRRSKAGSSCVAAKGGAAQSLNAPCMNWTEIWRQWCFHHSTLPGERHRWPMFKDNHGF